MDKLDDLLEAVEREIDQKSRILKNGWLKYLDFNYIPPNPRHREEEIKEICVRLIENVTHGSTGNILIYGNPGTGKTMSFHIAKRISEQILSKKNVENYEIVYTSATSPNLSKILSEICKKLGSEVPARGLSIREYLSYINSFAKEKYLHICIDEFDKLLENSRRKQYTEDLIYYLTRTENISATLITNKIDLAKSITDARVLSSLDTINTIYFKAYTKEQCKDILLERINLAFREGVFSEDAVDFLAEHIAECGGDIRNGLSILKFCGNYLTSRKLNRVDLKLMKELIWKHDIQKDGELLMKTLSLTDKIIVAAVYSLLLELKTERIDSGDVFARQDYFRTLLNRNGISRDSFSVYLTRLSTNGVIGIEKEWKSKRPGSKSYVYLKYSRNAVKYMLENDPTLKPVLEFIAQTIRGSS